MRCAVPQCVWREFGTRTALQRKVGTQEQALAARAKGTGEMAYKMIGLRPFVQSDLEGAEFAEIMAPAAIPLSKRQPGDELHLVRALPV